MKTVPKLPDITLYDKKESGLDLSNIILSDH